MINLEDIKSYFLQLQSEIVESLENLDGKSKFILDEWDRPEGGGGRTMVIQNGGVLEKGGVNFSHVHGAIPDFLKKESSEGDYFHATGLSLVLHPFNPFVPIVHMNVRYFQMLSKGKVVDEWFGGGIDLTPSYLAEKDGQHFHQTLKDACDPFGAQLYPKYKAICDSYFTIVHRQEMRGIGGIFFDHLRSDENTTKEDIFNFVQSVGNSFIPAYLPIAEKTKDLPFDQQHKEWQYLRRSRYAEFNLVYDRGTLFGLKTNGRIESILMSLPPECKWTYNFSPEAGSAEEEMLAYYQPREWC